MRGFWLIFKSCEWRELLVLGVWGWMGGRFDFCVIRFISLVLTFWSMTTVKTNYLEINSLTESRPWGSYTLLCSNIDLRGQGLEFKVLEMGAGEEFSPHVFDVDHYFYLLEGRDVSAYRATPLVSVEDITLEKMGVYYLTECGGNIVIPKKFFGAFVNESDSISKLLEFSFGPRKSERSLYADLGVDENFLTLKILELNAQSKLSVQSHAHRGEFWYVLDGEVVVHRGDRCTTIDETLRGLSSTSLVSTQVITIPQGMVHSLENVSDKPAKVLELSFGKYDEKDIVRYEDRYGRVEKK